jgi:predicted nucleic acid-binding protein
MIVADANLVAYLLIPGAHTAAAEKVYEIDSDWVAPPLWRSEFLNILVSAVRAKMLKQGQADTTWARAPSLILAEQEPDPLGVVRFAVKRGISGYDAQYVVLAQTLGTVAVTADKPLVRKCPEHVMSIDRFVAEAS